MLVTALIGLALALAASLTLLAIAVSRISRNAGVLTLEELARRNGIVYAPISRQLAAEMETWSKPLRLRLETHPDQPVATLVFTEKLTDEEQA